MDDKDVKPELNPVEQFEKGFQACLSVITKEDTLSNLDHDEIRVDTEFAIKELMEKARAVESYFLKKRLHIAHLKPELIIKDETNELRIELMRKDELLKKNYEKISQWQTTLADVQSGNAATIGGKNVAVICSQPASATMNTGPGPLTPGGSARPQTPGSVGRPQTPMGGPMTPQGTRMYQAPSMSQGPPSGLQGPLAFLEKTASTIGMNP